MCRDEFTIGVLFIGYFIVVLTIVCDDVDLSGLEVVIIFVVLILRTVSVSPSRLIGHHPVLAAASVTSVTSAAASAVASVELVVVAGEELADKVELGETRKR